MFKNLMAELGNVGINTLNGKTFGSYDFTGVLTVINCMFNERFKMTGELTVSNSKMKHFSFEGTATMTNTQISERSNITGLLTATECTFGSTVRVNSEHTELTLSTLQDIELSSNKPAKFILKGCTVHGNINFNGPSCEILVDQDTVIHGQVNNADVVNAPQNSL